MVTSVLQCPLCNGLFHFTPHCQECGGRMDDVGRIEDYLDDYSPYMEQHHTSFNHCTHLFQCQVCREDTIHMIPLQEVNQSHFSE